MDVVAYDTSEPVVIFAGADLDPATATAMVGPPADLRYFDTLDAAIDASENAERIDCVVTTAALAEGTGIELLEALRDRAANPDADLGGRHVTGPPAIYVPESGSVGDAEAATAAGATVYLPRDRAADGELRECLADVVEDYDRRRQLRRERELFDALFDHAPVPLYVKDRDARYVAASSYIAPGFDDSPLGHTSPEIQEGDPGAIESHRDDMRIIETGEPILEKEDRSISADGEVSWHRTTKHPLRTPGGEIEGIVGVARDITAAKERERQLERQRWRLEQFATFTSTELREPVTTAIDALDRARAAMDRTSGAPNDGASGATDDGASGSPNDDVQGSLPRGADAALATVDDELDRMQELIETLLTMARPQTEAPDPDWIDLASAADQSWSAIEGATATLEDRIDEHLEVRADADQLHRCLEHLFRNAMEPEPTADGASADEPEIEDGSVADDRLEAGESPADVRSAEPIEWIRVGLTESGFYVESEGSPIEPPDDPGADPFEYEGAGYRVAIARDIAEAHDWSFDVEPGEDGGVRFVLENCLLRPAALRTATEGAAAELSASGDVGGAEPPGEAIQADGGWVVHGGGRNVWQDLCEFYGVWASVEGDSRVEARVVDIDPVHEHSKAGIGFYDPEDDGAPLSGVALSGAEITESIGRSRTGESIATHLLPAHTGEGLYFRIDRVGDRVILSTSADGEDWTVVDHRRFYGPDRVVAGLLVCSHSADTRTTATFEHVRVTPLEVSE